MDQQMSHFENTAADKSAAGFTYQDFVYVYNLLQLEPEQELGIEVYDDLHKFTCEGLTLIQVKHSIGEGNLTDRDIDLWKTLYNWHMSIDEIPISKDLTLVIYTNKNLGTQEFIRLFQNPSKNKAQIHSKAKEILKDLEAKDLEKNQSAKAAGKEKPSENPILKYVRAIADANKESIYFILDRLQIQSNQIEIIEKIDRKLKTFAIPEKKIESVRNELTGAVSIYQFSNVLSSQKTIISYDCLRKQIGFDRIIQLAISLTTDFESYYDRFNELDISKLSFKDGVFSKQLVDLGFSKNEIFDHGIEMVLTEQVIEDLKQQGHFSTIEDTRLETQISSAWKDFHGEAHEEPHATETAHVKAAKQCLRSSRRKEYSSGDKKIPTEMGSGKLIKLSNKPSLGWRSDWEEKYRQ